MPQLIRQSSSPTVDELTINSGDPMSMTLRSLALPCAVFALACVARDSGRVEPDVVESLVRKHGLAWETGDTALLRAIIHPDARLAYPRRRVDRETWIDELSTFASTNADTKIYINEIIVDGRDFAVEWQFATTERTSGVRTAVGDAIIGRVRDGRIILWKEYLDGRVLELQREGLLGLDEGDEPHPWPRISG